MDIYIYKNMKGVSLAADRTQALQAQVLHFCSTK